VRDLQQGQLIPQARFPLTQRIDPASDGRHPLGDVESEALDQRGLDGPAAGRSDLFDGQLRTEDHAVLDADEASAPVRLDYLSVEQRGQWHPAWLGHGTFALAPFRLHPLAKMRQQCCAIILETIGQE